MENAAKTIASQIEFMKTYQQIGMQSAVWQDVVDVIRNLPEGSIPVKLELEHVEIFADLMLAQVFSNLFDNAQRHGQFAHAIRILGSLTPDAFNIIVADNGIGVAYEEKEKIFEQGYGKHTGLGLFLIREILGITGITIRETSRPGEGARFEIVVPQGMFRVQRKNAQPDSGLCTDSNS